MEPSIEKTKTQFKLTLPEPSIGYSTSEGRNLFRSALISGHAESFFRLSEQFRTQDNPAYCGISTLVMALNSMAIDPGRIWQGCWRYYHETMLNCCVPLDQVQISGITLDQFNCLALCNGAATTLVRAGGGTTKAVSSGSDAAILVRSATEVSSEKTTAATESNSKESIKLTTASITSKANCSKCTSNHSSPTKPPKGLSPIEQFRETVKEVCRHADGKVVLVVSYSRKILNQTGDGHFSPIAAYDPATDRALILDVARFKLPPHWVPICDLWKAMSALDASTGLPRGYLTLKPSFVNSTFVFLLRSDQKHWMKVASLLEKMTKSLAIPMDCKQNGGEVECNMELVVETLVNLLPIELLQSLTTYSNEFDVPYRPRDHEKVMDKVVPELEGTKLCQLVTNALSLQRPEFLTNNGDRKGMCPVLVTMLCLALPLDSVTCCKSSNVPEQESCGCGCNDQQSSCGSGVYHIGAGSYPKSCVLAIEEMRSTKGMSELLVKEIESLRTQISLLSSQQMDWNLVHNGMGIRDSLCCGSK